MARAQGGPIDDWVERARVLSDALALAVAQGSPPARVILAVERAYAAFYLDEVSEEDVGRVAHLCERAHDAIRKVRGAQLDPGIVNCARVLHLGLPSSIRRNVSQELVVEVVRGLRAEANRARAVSDATMRLVGWFDKFRERTEQVVLSLLAEQSQGADHDDGG